jgi:hypothetical protein
VVPTGWREFAFQILGVVVAVGGVMQHESTASGLRGAGGCCGDGGGVRKDGNYGKNGKNGTDGRKEMADRKLQ